MYPTELLNYVSREENYKEIFQLTDYDRSIDPNPAPPFIANDFTNDLRIKNTYLSKTYLTGAYVQNNLSSSTINWVNTRMRNILFDSESVDIHFKSGIAPTHLCAPYRS